MHIFTKVVLLASSLTVSALPCQLSTSLSAPIPSVNDFRYRYEVFDTPGTSVSNRLMIVALSIWTNELRREALSNPLPPEGLVLPFAAAGLRLTVRQQGDKTLIREDVLGAIRALSDHYPKEPKKTVALGEVHMLQGFMLQGTMDITRVTRTEGITRDDLRVGSINFCNVKDLKGS